MDTQLKPLLLPPWPDWLAPGLFFGSWWGYAHWARQRAQVRPSILATTNQWRRRWMLQATRCANRIVDAAVTQSLSASPSFFASASILIIGGLLAALGATDKSSSLVQDWFFSARAVMAATAAARVVLSRREFRSEALWTLREGLGPMPRPQPPPLPVLRLPRLRGR